MPRGRTFKFNVQRSTSTAVLPHAGDLEAFLFQERANLCGLVALDFNRAFLDRPATAAGGAELSGELLDFGKAEMGREIVNDDDRLASAMGGFPAEDDSALFLRRGGRGRRGRRWILSPPEGPANSSRKRPD